MTFTILIPVVTPLCTAQHGDFMTLFRSEAFSSHFDAIVTNFFLDTADNVRSSRLSIFPMKRFFTPCCIAGSRVFGSNTALPCSWRTVGQPWPFTMAFGECSGTLLGGPC